MLLNKHLIYELKKNNQEAFDIIYKEYHKLVFYVIYSKVKDVEVTKELVQDCFLKMWNNVHLYKNNNNFKAWLLTIAKNVALDYIKTKKDIYPLEEDIQDCRLPSMLNEFNIDARRILSEFEYNVVVLTIVYNLKRKEVADLLDKPLGTITRTYSDAIKKLKTFYKNKDN